MLATMVLNMIGAIEYTTFYNSPYRWGYQGQYAERDSETGLSAFMLRQYDGRIGRWTTIDPYGQYWSPYLGMGNNPVMFVDSDGRWAQFVAKHGVPAILGFIKGASTEFAGQVILNIINGEKLFYDIKVSQIMISGGQGFFKELAGSFKGGMASGVFEFGADIYGAFTKGIDAARLFWDKQPKREIEGVAIFLSTTITEFTFNNLLSNNLMMDKEIVMPQLNKFLMDNMINMLLDLNSKIIMNTITSVLSRNTNNSDVYLQNKYTKP